MKVNPRVSIRRQTGLTYKIVFTPEKHFSTEGKTEILRECSNLVSDKLTNISVVKAEK